MEQIRALQQVLVQICKPLNQAIKNKYHYSSNAAITIFLFLFHLPRAASLIFFADDAVKVLKHIHYVWMRSWLQRPFFQTMRGDKRAGKGAMLLQQTPLPWELQRSLGTTVILAPLVRWGLLLCVAVESRDRMLISHGLQTLMQEVSYRSPNATSSSLFHHERMIFWTS